MDTDTDGDATPGTDTDPTAVARELYDALPFNQTHGIEVVEVTETSAQTRWPFDESLVGNPEIPAIHGGVVSALADLTGAVVFVGNVGRYTPTVDLRVDYLSHVEVGTDLVGRATVVRRGETVGVADVTVEADGERRATARGVYKLAR